MLRRPPTSVELKLDDIMEYDNMRAELKEKAASQKSGEGAGETWIKGPKTKVEIYSRIGYEPPTTRSNTGAGQSNRLMFDSN